MTTTTYEPQSLAWGPPPFEPIDKVLVFFIVVALIAFLWY